MTISSDDSVELEAKVAPPPRLSHHRARRRKRIAARVLLILALVIGFVAISDFAYNAYILTSLLIMCIRDQATHPSEALEVSLATVAG